MKKLFLIAALVAALAAPAFAGKLTVGSSNQGQYTDLKVSGANATYTKVTGDEAIIDLSQVAQTSTTANTPVVTMTQSDTDESFINFVGTSATSGQSTSVVTYSSAQAEAGAQAGAIKVKINGSTYWMHFFTS